MKKSDVMKEKPEIEYSDSRVDEALEWVSQVVRGTQDFVLEQAPLYCQELIAYQIVSNTVSSIIFLIATLLFAGFAFFCLKKFALRPYDCWELPATFFGILAIITFVGMIVSVDCVIKAEVAPRVVIVEHIKKATQ